VASQEAAPNEYAPLEALPSFTTGPDSGLINMLVSVARSLARGDRDAARRFAAHALDDLSATERSESEDWRRLQLTPAAAEVLTAFAFMEAQSEAYGEAIAKVIVQGAVDGVKDRALANCLGFAATRAMPAPAVFKRLKESRERMIKRAAREMKREEKSKASGARRAA
jgi:hypothetical protein